MDRSFSLPDDSGDVLDPTALDLESVEYRVNGTTIEMRITAASVIDPMTAFIEAWGRSGGGGYAYYRWVVQSGVGTLQGTYFGCWISATRLLDGFVSG